MENSKFSMSEGSARFWTAVFGGITAISLVAAGMYTLFEYFDAKQRENEARDKDRAALQLQIAATALSAKQAFNNKHLDLCAEAAIAAGTVATTRDAGKRREAEDDFWRLYWGPLGIVEDSEVANAMVAFGQCLEGTCRDRPVKQLALGLAHACRVEVSRDFQIQLPTVPDRPLPKAKE